MFDKLSDRGHQGEHHSPGNRLQTGHLYQTRKRVRPCDPGDPLATGKEPQGSQQWDEIESCPLRTDGSNKRQSQRRYRRNLGRPSAEVEHSYRQTAGPKIGQEKFHASPIVIGQAR